MKGTIQNRDQFLDNIAHNLGRERNTQGVKRPSWEHQPQWEVLKNSTEDDLVEVLEKQCAAIHTDVFRTNVEQLGATVEQVIQSNQGRSVLAWDDPRFLSFGLEYAFDLLSNKGIDIHKWDSSMGDENIQVAEQADVGITFSDVTLAESGTVVLFSDNGKGRSVSLLPSTYIAIIPKSTLVPRMSQATREIHQRVESGEDVASCVNFISGPSNSADIEMNLVVGVHGPIKATYIVVEDR